MIDNQGAPITTEINEGNENFNFDYLRIKTSGVRGVARGGYWDNNMETGVYVMYLVVSRNFAGTGIVFRCASKVITVSARG